MNQLELIKDKVLACVNERISLIDYEHDKYKCNAFLIGDYSYVSVKYDNVEFLRFNIIISKKVLDGQKIISNQIYIYAFDDASWCNNRLTYKNINVNEKMMCDGRPLLEILDERLPLGGKKEIQRIESVLHEKDIVYNSICFDTINNRYVISLEPQLDDCQQDAFEGKCVYKYTSLKTFLEIARNKTMRLNSIVSMNDTSEAFFLGDYLCNAYNDNLREKFELGYDKMDKEGLRHSKLLEYKNYLIGSFTTNEDDPIMWERYGDKYKGVCIGFKYNPHNIKPIIYCGRNKDTFFYKLKTISEILNCERIAIYFDFISEEQFFVKHWQFESENELRLLKKCDDTDKEFRYDLYGDLITYYREYNLKELDLEPVSLSIGAYMPNKDVNFPIVCNLAKSNLGISDIYVSNCDKFRF